MSKKNPYKRDIPKGMVACGGVLRLYPDSEQVKQLFQNFGNCRFVFNRYKATFDERYENNPDLKVPDKYALKKLLPCLKQWYGKKLIVVPPQYTSRTCSACGQRNYNFTGMKTNEWLAVREWTCPFCHAHHDRDINAAKNILCKGIRQAD